MVAAVGVLAVRRAAELAAPDHQRVVEQPARAQVRQQAGDRPVDGPGVPGVAGLQAAVLVPVAVRQLDEADAGLDEAPGQQALAAEVGGRRVVEAVEAFVAADSPARSITPGSFPCMRKASS